MKKIGWLMVAVILVTTAALYLGRSANDEQKVLVAAVFPVTVDAFVQFQTQAKKTLAKERVGFVVFSAEGDATRFHSVLDLAIKRGPDVLIIVGTQLTNIGLGSRYSNLEIPIIVSCISDPKKVDALNTIGINPPIALFI